MHSVLTNWQPVTKNGKKERESLWLAWKYMKELFSRRHYDRVSGKRSSLSVET